MMSLKTEADILRETVQAIRQQRLALNLPQAELAVRSGVPLPTLRRLEQTGRGGLMTLAKVLTSLGMADQFIEALKRPQESAPSIKAFMAANGPGRKRARRPRTTRNASARA